jgi:Domain of unknown function (DUF4111)/Nucleotidyltransferase domain
VSSYGWAEAPAALRTQVDGLAAGLGDVLGESLVGVYLHGSLALGCFNPRRSDVDVLAVTRRPMPRGERRRIGEIVLAHSGPHGSSPPWPLEISVLSLGDIHPWKYPTPYDFHYSPGAHEDAEGRERDDPDRRDADLAAHVTVVRRCGVRLVGDPIERVFPAVPRADYLDSLRRDLSWCRTQARPLYAVLSASRIWAAVADPETIHSKETGAAWALAAAPEPFRPLVAQALAVYRGMTDDAGFGASEVARYLDHVEGELVAG